MMNSGTEGKKTGLQKKVKYRRKEIKANVVFIYFFWLRNSDQLRSPKPGSDSDGVGVEVIERDFFPRFRYNIHML